MTGVNIVQIPYRGQAPALTDLLAGQVQVMVLGRCFAKAGTPEEALVLFECARKQRANGVQLASYEQVKLQQGSSLGDFTPGRRAPDRGLFDYNPVTVPI